MLAEAEMSENWYMLDRLEALIGGMGQRDGAEKAGALLPAIASAMVEALTAPTKRATLEEGAYRAAALLDQIRTKHAFDEASPAYVAGRLATVIDALALIARARAVDELPELARAEIETLRALHPTPLSNKAVATVRRISEEAACISLRKCRRLGLVETGKVGRENRNRLTQLAQALFDDGILQLTEGSGAYSMDCILRRSGAGNLARSATLPKITI